ncbi:hypothetical protein ACFSJW_15755 [Flavobacterium artemisiae]|uniref:Uncharacterized protein n=1 Tax=Flavobacterium artemisiae TaxID=2126556 RepID=A0ABW4H7W8_9FLAO
MDWIYLIRLWLFTIIYGPIIFLIKIFLETSNGSNLFSNMQFYVLAFVLGGLFSIPTFVFAAVFFIFLENHNLKRNFIKAALTLTFIAGIFATLRIINGSVAMDIALSYSIAALIVGISFRLKSIKN